LYWQSKTSSCITHLVFYLNKNYLGGWYMLLYDEECSGSLGWWSMPLFYWLVFWWWHNCFLGQWPIFFSFLRIPLPPVKQIQKAIVVSPSHNEFPICKKKVVPIWMIPFNFQCNITLLLILLASLPIRYLSLCIFGKVE
jgi:hypothetical protein